MVFCSLLDFVVTVGCSIAGLFARLGGFGVGDFVLLVALGSVIYGVWLRFVVLFWF